MFGRQAKLMSIEAGRKTKDTESMSHLILNIKDKRKMPFLKELLKYIDFVEVVDPKTIKANRSKQLLKDIDDAVDFVKDFKKGKIKAKSFKQLMNEL